MTAVGEGVVDHDFHKVGHCSDLVFESRDFCALICNCKLLLVCMLHMVDNTGIFKFLLVGVVSTGVSDEISLEIWQRFGA